MSHWTLGKKTHLWIEGKFHSLKDALCEQNSLFLKGSFASGASSLNWSLGDNPTSYLLVIHFFLTQVRLNRTKKVSQTLVQGYRQLASWQSNHNATLQNRIKSSASQTPAHCLLALGKGHPLWTLSFAALCCGLWAWKWQWSVTSGNCALHLQHWGT